MSDNEFEQADADAMETVRRLNPALYQFLASSRRDVEEYYDSSNIKAYKAPPSPEAK